MKPLKNRSGWRKKTGWYGYRGKGVYTMPCAMGSSNKREPGRKGGRKRKKQRQG